ncbi:uncharacterized protein LOC144158958 [Haemaphysalis longicornis]
MGFPGVSWNGRRYNSRITINFTLVRPFLVWSWPFLAFRELAEPSRLRICPAATNLARRASASRAPAVQPEHSGWEDKLTSSRPYKQQILEDTARRGTKDPGSLD